MSSPSPRRSTESFEILSTPPTQSGQFPFPQNDWSAPRPSSTGGRYQPRRGSTASSLHSVGGVLDSSFKASMGAVREQNHNAISTLLQPPIVRTGMLPHTSASAASSHKPPSTRDIPPVTLPNIPHIESSSFKPYLSQIGNLYDIFQRAKAETAANTPRKDSLKKQDQPEDLQFASPATPNLGPTVSPSSSPRPKRRISGSKRAAPAVTPLSTIPNVYFDDNFHLENPRTFDIVSERSEVVRPVHTKSSDDIKTANGSLEPAQPARKALATNAILQEKLSWYMDTVEVHLISSISTASTSFFAALGSLRELHSEASESVAKIKEVREDLARLDEQMAVGGLKIVDMRRRRENLRKLTDATDQLQCIITGLSHCDEVVDQGELEMAMSRLEVIDRLVSGTLDGSEYPNVSWLQPQLPPTIVDLRQLRALEGVADGMQQIRFRIGKGFEMRFLDTLLGDLREHVKTVPNRDTLERWVAASQRGRSDQAKNKSLPAYVTTSETFRHALRANLMGLSGSHFTAQASAAFRDAVLREMKVLIRHHLPSSTDDDAESMTSVSTRSSRAHSQQEKNSILARNLRAMDPADAEDFFVNIFTDIGEALRRLSVQVKVLLDVTSGVSTPPPSSGGMRSPPRSPSYLNMDGYLGKEAHSDATNGLQEELMQALDMSSLLGQAVDAAQAQITKLLKVRSEATTHLPLDRFLRYFNLCRMFADECEAVSGRSGTALKGVVNNHINDFVSKYGDMEKQQLAQAMESDRWDPRDFDDSDNVVLNRILQGMTSDPAVWGQTGAITDDLQENGHETLPKQVNGDAKEKSKSTTPALIDEERFFISDSAAVVLRGIDRFESLLSVIPSMTAEVSTILCEYLKLFNSRLCQLILGAGAMQSAGLKNINTKHLAIASQTLSFIITLSPYIRECARRHASGKPPSAEFDNVKRLLQDQQVSIHDKLIDILRNRAAMHVKNLKKIEWDNDTERNISPNMETLTKETVTLHKVISKYFADIAVRMIMMPVFTSYREQVGTVFKEAIVKTAPGKARLLRDAKLFEARLEHIDGYGDTGEYLVTLVEGKAPPEDTTTSEPTPTGEEKKV